MGDWVSDPKRIREFPGVSDQGSVREFIDFLKNRYEFKHDNPVYLYLWEEFHLLYPKSMERTIRYASFYVGLAPSKYLPKNKRSGFRV